MPGKLKVRVMAARDLPVMDRASDLTDAFVEIRFINTVFKTDVCRKSLNPLWNSEWYRFEVDDEDLQDEPLEIKVLDHDTYSAHDAIGKVYIDLNPLLVKDHGLVISGWFPLYDTMHGIRGEIQVVVKVELFSDVNRFRQSSCGVQFFCCAGVPYGYRVSAIHGFVEELVVNDDPEYQWIDKIRTQRASNEARQKLFSKLSGELQRKIGLKVLELGGNSVIGYKQCFDLEGESGVVVRAIGTVVTLNKYTNLHSPTSSSPGRDSSLPEDSVVAPCSPVVTPTLLSPSPVRPPINPVTTPQAAVSASVSLHRRSSDSDLGTPPRGGSLTGSSSSVGGGSVRTSVYNRLVVHQQTVDMMEYPFFTMTSFPSGFLVHIGGVVSARSVKLLDKIHNPDEPETRDAWWTELRTEIRSHMRAMGCHAVLGYKEQTTICDEVIILSASGTAAIVNLNLEQDLRQNMLSTSLDRHAFEKDRDRDKKLHVDVNLANQLSQGRLHVITDGNDAEFVLPINCGVCHVPYSETSAPFPISLNRCAVCKKHKVPDVLFSTLQPPADLPVVGRGCLIQSRICRPKKEGKGETNAKDISDNLPFMEYELHNQLLNKLKIKGMNSLFGVRVQVSVGEKLLVAVATGTAVYCAALPPPPIPRILGKADMSLQDKHIEEMQRKIIETVNKNKETYGIYPTEFGFDHSPRSSGALTDDSEDEQTDLDLVSGNKDTFVLEIYDAEDIDVVSILLDSPVPDGFDICNTERMPGLYNMACAAQMFTRVWRGQISVLNNKSFSTLCENLFKSLYFKMRKMSPCCLCDVDFNVDLPEDDIIQISITGMCVGLSEPHTVANSLLATVPSVKQVSGQHGDREDMIFQMEGVSDTVGLSQAGLTPPSIHPLAKVVKNEKKIKYYSPVKQRGGVEITPMSFIPGTRIEHYLGHLNVFMIRESTAIREDGGLNGFIHSFIGEVMAIMRAHVSALGGNALLSYRMNQCVLEDNLGKNQGQCLVNVYGDVVQVNYNIELSMIPSTTGTLGVSPANLARRITPRNSPCNSPKERLHQRSSTS